MRSSATARSLSRGRPHRGGRRLLVGPDLDVVHHTLGGRRRGRAHPEIRFAAAAGALVVEGPGLGAVPDRAATLARMVRDGVRKLVVPAVADRVGDEADLAGPEPDA